MADPKPLWEIERVKTSQEHLIHKYFLPQKHKKDYIAYVKHYNLNKIKQKYEELNPAQVEYQPGITIKEKDIPFFLTEYILKYHKPELMKDPNLDKLSELLQKALSELLIMGYATHMHSRISIYNPLKILLQHKISQLKL